MRPGDRSTGILMKRQGLVRAALEEAEEDEPLPFVASAEMRNGVDALVSAMRSVLGFNAGESSANRRP